MPAIHMAKSPVVVVDVTVNLLKRWSRSVRYSGLVRVTLLITVIDRRLAFDTYTTRSLYFHQKVSTRTLKLEFLA
jgi:hypothetical protein